MKPMPIDFNLSLRQGPSSPGYMKFSKEFYSQHELNIGSLEKNAFSNLSEWIILNRKKYAIALRVGTKEPFLTKDGKLATLLVIFSQYLFSREDPITEEEYKEEEKTFQHMLEEIIIDEGYNEKRNVCGLIMNAPQYMIDELKEEFNIK